MTEDLRYPDIELALARVEEDLEHSEGQARLRAIRDLFDDATFLPHVRDLLARRHNDPQIYEIPNRLARIMRRAEELRDDRDTDRGSAAQLAVGGGGGLIVGSVIAALNPAIGMLALVPAVGGIAIAGISWLGLRKLDRERTLFRQIAERLSIIVRAVE